MPRFFFWWGQVFLLAVMLGPTVWFKTGPPKNWMIHLKYPLVIKHGNGKSPINRAFTGKIVYKQGIFQCYVWLPKGNHCLFSRFWRQLRPVTAFYGFNTFTTLADLQGLFSKGRSLGSTILKTLRSLQSIHITHTHIYIYHIYIYQI